MKFSESWLRELIDIDLSSEDLAAQLTMIGHEVDTVEIDGNGLKGLVVAEIKSFEKHPNADRLNVCQVTTDGKNNYNIVCGAPNVSKGLKSVLALPGQLLPNGLKLKKSKIRDIESFGMLCSAAEIGLGQESDGIMELPSDTKNGLSLEEYLKLPDNIIDLDLTPNRGDCFSLLGVARDLAGTTNKNIKYSFDIKNPTTSDIEHPINVDNAELCPRFVAQSIINIDNKATTPLWIKEKLRKSGLRPINPIVDVTNFVMMEIGQPLHAYDLSKINGPVSPRMAKQDETLTLLDENKVTLDQQTIVISDRSGPIGMAGVMGGLSTAVSQQTISVLFEAAYWPPSLMAGVARRYGMHTDASLRFERGVDPEIQVVAINRATQLLLSICGGNAGVISDIKSDNFLPKTQIIKLTAKRLQRILGDKIDSNVVTTILKRLNLKVKELKNDWVVEIPVYRFDLKIEDDLIEEIARIFGYNKIKESSEISTKILTTSNFSLINNEKIANQLCARDYQEVITYSFVDEKLDKLITNKVNNLKLKNPLSSEFAVMRGSIWPGLLQAAARNTARQNERVRLFEVGKIYKATKDSHQEIPQVAGLITGSVNNEHWSEKSKNISFFDIKGDIESLLPMNTADLDYEYVACEHPALQNGQAAEILLNNNSIGFLGKVHPRVTKKYLLKRDVFVFELDLEKAFLDLLVTAKPISKYPSIRRDISIVVSKDTSAAEVINNIKIINTKIIQSVKVFDIYEGDNIEEGRKSVALGLILQEKSRTLTDEVADEIISKVIQMLQSNFSAKLRD
jgi:phenylalanyl-tRNA synthetase beta chain